MQIHSLGLEDFCEDECSLIGIHTALEDFKLAYLLNKNLGTSFYKSREDLNFENHPSGSCCCRRRDGPFSF